MNTYQANEKSQLVNSLEKSGLLDSMKAYMKSKMLDALNSQSTRFSQTNNFDKNTYNPLSSTSTNISPLIRISLSIVQDFLQKSNLNYTLSVFKSEAKSVLNSSLPYSESELLNVLGLNTKIMEDYYQETKNIFLCHILKDKTRVLKEDNEAQTDVNLLTEEKANFFNLEETLRNIDIKHDKKLDLENLMPSKVFEDKFQKYKEEVDLKYKEDYESQLKRFKDIEMSQMRIEENKKYIAKLEQVRDEYEKEYKEKYEAMKKRESDNNQRIANKEKMIEDEKFRNRQNMENQLDLLKQKEAQLQQGIDNERKEINIEKERLRNKEKELDNLQTSYNQKFNSELNKYKLEVDRKMFDDKKNFEMEKSMFENKYSGQIDLMEKINAKEKENKELRLEVDRLRNRLSQYEKDIDRYKTSYENAQITMGNIGTLGNNSKDSDQAISQLTMENNNCKRQINDLNSEINNLKKQIEIQNMNINSMNNNMNTINTNMNTQKYNSNNNRDANNTSAFSTGYVGNKDNERIINRMNSMERNMKNTLTQLMNEKNNSPPQSNSKPQRQSNPINNNYINNVPNSIQSKAEIQNQIRLARKLKNKRDPREVLSGLEEEQMKLDAQMKQEFRNITKQEVPIIVLSEEEIQQIKRNNYFNTVTVNEEREKFINEQYRKKNEMLAEISNKEAINNMNKMNAQANAINYPNNNNVILMKTVDNNQYINPMNQPSTNINKLGDYQNPKDNMNKSLIKSINLGDDNKKLSESQLSRSVGVPGNTSILKKEGTRQQQMMNQMKSPNKPEQPSPTIIGQKDRDRSLSGDKKKIKASIDGSYREEFDVSQSKGKNIHLPPLDQSHKSKGSGGNKFQNIDYESKNDIPENINKEKSEEIEEYDDFINDSEGLDKIDAYGKKSSAGINHQSIKASKKDISVSSIHNKSGNSNISQNIDKILQSKGGVVSSIEENIEEDYSYDGGNKSAKKKVTINTGSNNNNSKDKKDVISSRSKEPEAESSSNMYNDFEKSNAFKEGATEEDIQEDIQGGYDDDVF